MGWGDWAGCAAISLIDFMFTSSPEETCSKCQGLKSKLGNDRGSQRQREQHLKGTKEYVTNYKREVKVKRLAVSKSVIWPSRNYGWNSDPVNCTTYKVYVTARHVPAWVHRVCSPYVSAQDVKGAISVPVLHSMWGKRILVSDIAWSACIWHLQMRCDTGNTQDEVFLFNPK